MNPILVLTLCPFKKLDTPAKKVFLDLAQPVPVKYKDWLIMLNKAYAGWGNVEMMFKYFYREERGYDVPPGLWTEYTHVVDVEKGALYNTFGTDYEKMWRAMKPLFFLKNL